MNPPYGRGNIDPAVGKFIDQWQQRRFRQGIVLVNNVTETAWAQALFRNASSMCWPTGRISFVSVDGKESSSNTRGQIVYYFGRATSRFQQSFSAIGPAR